MRRTARLAVIALILGSALGCARPPSPARPFDRAVSVTDLRAAPAALADVGSGRFEVGVVVEGPDGLEEVRAVGAFAGGAVVIDVDLRARFATAAERLRQAIPPGVDTDGRIVLDGSTMYVRVPVLHELAGDPSWLSVSTSAVHAAPAFESSVVDPSRLVATLRGVVEVQEVGREVVRGVSTAQVATTLPDGRALHVWLDADHLVRRLRYVLDEVGAGLGRAAITVELFDYGDPVEIDVPGPREHIPYADLVHELLEAGGVKVRDIEIEGVDGATVLRLAEAGAGGRPLVLVHGFTGAKEDFTDWLDPLAELGWHAIAPDQRGHGESPKPADETAYSVEGFAHDLLALVDAMGWSTVAALGHSMGGMVLQAAALRAPHRFDALILMDTSHKALRADRELIDLAVTLVRTEGMPALLAAQEALSGDGPLANDIDRRLKAERPGYKEFGDGKLLASAPAMYAAMISSITDPAMEDRLELLRSLTMPSLVVVGEHDRPFVRPSERMAGALPNAELVRVAGAAHSPQFESPDAWWSAIAGFLSRLP